MLMNTSPEKMTLLEALDISALPAEEQEELLLDLNSLVFRGTLVRLIERMDEDARKDFDALMETDPDEAEVEAFLMERVPDADTAVEETLQDLTNDIVAVTKANE